jgi:triphosphoribosyl-dephospho-CoA synthase
MSNGEGLDPRSPGRLGMLACILEASAPKAGNVHRCADFDDVTYVDYLLSAAAIAGPLDRAREWGVGRTVLECVRATREVARTNTNLGMIFLFAPLAVGTAAGESLESGVARVLGGLTIDDTRAVYEAIRLARPGGLGRVDRHDVCADPEIDLRAAMGEAAERDLVAAQYVNSYEHVFKIVLPSLRRQLRLGRALEAGIVGCQIEVMARLPDSLIARKRGPEVAAEASRRAAGLLASGWPDTPASAARFAEFDDWLRADGHARNPGTIADLIAAALYAGLYDGTIDLRQAAWSERGGLGGRRQ